MTSPRWCQGNTAKDVASGQIDSYPIQGDGQQSVWVNADSVQNSQAANISLQSLSALIGGDSRQLAGSR